MVKLICKLSFLLTTLLILSFSGASPSIKGDIVLNEIDIDTLYPLKMIMEDVISEKEDCTSMFYSVFLDRHGTATSVYVTRETSHQLIDSDDYIGYFTIDNDTVIIRTPNSTDIDISRKSKMSAFTLSQDPPMTCDPDKWLYSICFDSFARYVNGIGWVWLYITDTTPNGNKALLTIPKRLLKNDEHVTKIH